MSEHTDVGAYSLGLLEPQDRAAFEAHLGQCQSCASELAELSALALLLAEAAPVADAAAADAAAEPGLAATAAAGPAAGSAAGERAPDESAIIALIRRRAAAQRRRVRWQAGLAVAAGIVLAAGGLSAGLAFAPSQPAPAVSAVAGELHSATDPATGVTGTVGLVAAGWGTQITLDLANVKGPLHCQLVAVAKSGSRQVVMSWLVPAAGYGVPGHPAHLVIQGSADIQRKDISRLEVDIAGGGPLVNIRT